MSHEAATATIELPGEAAAESFGDVLDAPDRRLAAAATAPFVSAGIYQHQDAEGERLIVNHDEGRYHRIRRRVLAERSLAGGASSVAVRASSDLVAGGELILFNQDGFRGKYQRFPVAAGESRRQNLSFFMNDELGSALLLRRSPRETSIAVGGLGVGAQITNLLLAADQRIAPAGRPVFTWDMWPAEDGTPAQLRDRELLLVKIPFDVDSPGANHSAELLAWIRPLVAGAPEARTFRATLAFLRLNVSGWIAGRVADELAPRLLPVARQGLAPMIQAAVSTAMRAPFRSHYLLPGDGRSLAGQTEDDVAIVFVS
jgi:hypothetical protein